MYRPLVAKDIKDLFDFEPSSDSSPTYKQTAFQSLPSTTFTRNVRNPLAVVRGTPCTQTLSRASDKRCEGKTLYLREPGQGSPLLSLASYAESEPTQRDEKGACRVENTFSKTALANAWTLTARTCGRSSPANHSDFDILMVICLRSLAADVLRHS